jgi:hypothetical protein
MKEIHFARWHLESDSEATRAAYATLDPDIATVGDWDSGRNWILARDQGLVYPDAVLTLFTQLGIDYQRDAELYRVARLDSGLHKYGGWFHFVGTIVSGRDAMVPVGIGAFHHDLEQISTNFALGFTARITLPEPSFKGHPVVQIEYDADIPWLLGEPEPG